MRWLYKLEYKYGRYYIPNLMFFVVCGMVVVFVLDMFFGNMNSPTIQSASSILALDTGKILQGQLWRLITFIFIPEVGSPFLAFIHLYFFYMIGRLLEQNWGGFRLNLFYLIGILGTILGSFLSHLVLSLVYGGSVSAYGSNMFLNMSLFLALATLMPDTKFLLFFFIPVKAKWLALFEAVVFVIWPLVDSFFINPIYGLYQLIIMVCSLLNYVVFFGPDWVQRIRDQIRISRNRRNWRNNNNNWR